jgi:diguanylate cyclase (GGDEF)-like protein
MTISRKFFAVLAVLAPLIVAVALAGVAGLGSLRSQLDLVFGDNFHTSQLSTTTGADLAHAEEIALRLATATNPGQRRSLNATLDQSVVPAVDVDLAQLQTLHAHDSLSERARVQRLQRGWSQFVALRDTGVLGAAGVAGGLAAADRVTDQIAGIFDPLRTITQAEANLEVAQAGQAHALAIHSDDTSRLAVWAIALAALGLGVGSMLVLTRNVVPRIRRYSQFASAIADGDLSRRLTPRGSDELAILGRRLNEMVERREFVEALQVTAGEEVAHDLLKRQIERSITGSTVVVLNRNNSDDRLEATTALNGDSPLRETLNNAKPGSCLAVLFARSHNEDPDREPLTRCSVCGKGGRRATCEPLLVSGEVIGSVLVEHNHPLSASEATALRESVSQAAPLLANLRHLALADFRASTDALTGLPNKRAVKDSVKRMAAQASRSLSPLSAIMLDLDQFKQINDSFGHGRGDDVLAAVGAALNATVRASDFVGRNGGEEFIVLLPDTDARNAAIAAEKIRAAIATITVAGIDRGVTASLGVAAIPEHASDGDQLVRSADRALYVAKTNGRNRTETALTTSSNEPERTSTY